MYKIGQLTKMFDLSRTALLYYDSIDLLKPSARTEGNYRLYSDEDIRRLEQICMYRKMGIELKVIKGLLDNKSNDCSLLEGALLKLEDEIEVIRSKQRSILQVMQHSNNLMTSRKDIFSEVLENMGMSEQDMMNFHAVFEEKDSFGHKAFLEFLGLTQREIKEVVEHSR